MLKFISIGAMIVVSAFLSSCTAMSVHRDKESVGGIPFLAQIPQSAHVSKWLVPFDTISISATISDKTGKKLGSPKTTFPGPIFVYEHPGLATEILGLKNVIAKKIKEKYSSKEEIENAIERGRPDISSAMLAIQDQYKALPDKGDLVLNQVLTESVIDNETYYLNFNQPLIGSVDANVELNLNGTLKTAKAKVEDSTFSTLISALPALFGVAATGAAPKSSGKDVKAMNTELDFTGFGNKGEQEVFKLDVVINVEASLKTITLRKLCGKLSSAECFGPTSSLLTLEKAKKGEDGIEIEAIEAYPPLTPASPPKQEGKKKKGDDSGSSDDGQ